MSGPKVSVYKLTPEQLAALEAELKRRQEIALEQLTLLKNSENRAKEIRAHQELCLDAGNFIAKYEKWTDSTVLKGLVDECQYEMMDCLNENSACTTFKSNDELKAILSKVDSKLDKIRLLIQQIQEGLINLKKSLECTLNQEISSLFENQVSSEEIKGKVYSQFVNKSITVLFELQNNEYLPQIYRNEIDATISRLEVAKENDNLENFCQFELDEVLKKCNNFLELWKKYGQEYTVLCLKYEMLCNQCNDFDIEMVPFSENAVDLLKQLIVEREQKLKEQAEQEYICNALGEVMQDMGYDVLGHREVTKRNGKHFENDLYQYNKDTAINVTYSDNGQIALELGKMDHDDRVPTDVECCYLENAMTRFCGVFKEIEQRLLAKGIVVGDRIALAPPSADYAQIINVEDYELVEKETSKVHSHSAKANNNPMHMEQ